jgi:hypothetical protein
MKYKYYGWSGKESGKESGKLNFLIQEIERLKGVSPYHPGWRVADTGKTIYSNYGPRALTFDKDIELDKLNIFHTMEEAMQEVIRGLFRA